MKKTLCRLVIAWTVVICFISCNKTDVNKNRIVRVLDELNDEITIHRPEEGDFKIGVPSDNITAMWTEDSCIVTHKGVGWGGDEDFELSLPFGELVKIEIPGIPKSVIWWCFLSYEDDPLPEEWIELLEEKERIRKAHETYGSFDNYLSSRDCDTEIAIINQACKDSAFYDIYVHGWYRTFAQILWAKCDFDVKIKSATIEEGEDIWTVHLVLIDEKGGRFDIWGWKEPRLIYYNGELYFQVRE